MIKTHLTPDEIWEESNVDPVLQFQKNYERNAEQRRQEHNKRLPGVGMFRSLRDNLFWPTVYSPIRATPDKLASRFLTSVLAPAFDDSYTNPNYKSPWLPLTSVKNAALNIGTQSLRMFVNEQQRRFAEKTQRELKDPRMYYDIGKQGAQNIDTAEKKDYNKDETALLRKFYEAEQAEKLGYSPERILNETGVFRGQDGLLRYRIPNGKLIPDVRLKFDSVFSSLLSQKTSPYEDPKFTYLKTKDVTSLPLAEIYDAPKLYKAYPELKVLPVWFKKIMPPGTLGELSGYGSEGYPQTQKPYLSNLRMDAIKFLDRKGRIKPEALNTLEHEIQHAIQLIEQFARGGGVFVREDLNDDIKWREINTPNDPRLADLRKLLTVSDYEIYRRLLGEMEAREAAKHQGLSEEQLQQLPIITETGVINTRDYPLPKISRERLPAPTGK